MDGQQLELFSQTDFEESIPEEETVTPKEYDLTELFERLSHSDFRSRFYLNKKDKAYIAEKGLDVIRQHAADFIAKRLAPAVIPNDGKTFKSLHSFFLGKIYLRKIACFKIRLYFCGVFFTQDAKMEEKKSGVLNLPS